MIYIFIYPLEDPADKVFDDGVDSMNNFLK